MGLTSPRPLSPFYQIIELEGIHQSGNVPKKRKPIPIYAWEARFCGI
jgi:hypothetical protein